MKITFWAYAPAFEDEHGASGRFAGFCENKNVHGLCVCHHDCIAIDVVEMKTWNEVRRHANYLATFNADDGVVDPDEPLEQTTSTCADCEHIAEADGDILPSACATHGGNARAPEGSVSSALPDGAHVGFGCAPTTEVPGTKAQVRAREPRMTKFQAYREAHQRWATLGIASTDRVAMVTLRRKTLVNRCEVGWYLRGDCVPVVAGSGPTWEAAFADADARVRTRSA